MKHDFIEANRHLYGAKLLCQALQVSRSGFYAAKHRLPSARWQRQTMLTSQISAIHSASRDTYGAPRIHAELAARGVACSHNTVARLMRQAAIMPRCIRRFRVTTDSRKTKASPNLVSRNFHARRPNATVDNGSKLEVHFTPCLRRPPAADRSSRHSADNYR